MQQGQAGGVAEACPSDLLPVVPLHAAWERKQTSGRKGIMAIMLLVLLQDPQRMVSVQDRYSAAPRLTPGCRVWR